MKMLIFLLGLAIPATAATLNVSIGWWTVDGGGGTSTGDIYSITGTVGQPDTEAMSGSAFALQGGFWSLVAVQTAGAPTLSIFHTGTNTVVVSWPSPSAGWNLQQNTNGIQTLNWSNVVSGIQDDGTIKTLIVNPPTGNRFYRLQSPQ